MVISSVNLKFRYLPNDRNIFLLTAPSLPHAPDATHPFNVRAKQSFGNTRFLTVPYQSKIRGNAEFNVLIGYTRKHDGDLTRITVVPRESEVEITAMSVEDARQVAVALSLPLLVMINDEDEADGQATTDVGTMIGAKSSAYFHDPKLRKKEV